MRTTSSTRKTYCGVRDTKVCVCQCDICSTIKIMVDNMLSFPFAPLGYAYESLGIQSKSEWTRRCPFRLLCGGSIEQGIFKQGTQSMERMYYEF